MFFCCRKKEFLKAYEYIISDTEEILLFLKKRVKMFYQQKEEFPHEIGIFLQASTHGDAIWYDMILLFSN